MSNVQDLTADQVLLMKLAGMIEQDQCGDRWDMNDVSEDDHYRLPDLIRSFALRSSAESDPLQGRSHHQLRVGVDPAVL